ncbi:hypothetical protein QL285_045720 [Trifolium repens]|nr:hypothetical protein QL285_045720 [Trifolium repens]
MVAPKMARYCRIVQKILLWNQNNFGVPTSFRVVIVSIQVSFSGRQVLRSKDQDETDRWGRGWIVRSEAYIFLPCFSYLFCTRSSFRCIFMLD